MSRQPDRTTCYSLETGQRQSNLHLQRLPASHTARLSNDLGHGALLVSALIMTDV